MLGGPDRIAHVVQAIEDSDKVVILTRELLSLQNRRSSLTATNVGHAPARFQFLLHVVERRNPGRHQIGGITRAEKFLAAVEDAVGMLVPTHAGSGAKRIGNTWH